MKIKVEQMKSSRSDRPAANQFTIITSDGEYFQSYDSVIAFKDNEGNVTLDDYTWNYSRTTSKYRNEFLSESIVETRAKIESGEYKLSNLN